VDGDEGAGGGWTDGEDALEEVVEDRRLPDTRLSRAVIGKDAGPRLRSSYPRSVVTTAGYAPSPLHDRRVMPPGSRLEREERDWLGVIFLASFNCSVQHIWPLANDQIS
jgi:hypothetical protein